MKNQFGEHTMDLLKSLNKKDDDLEVLDIGHGGIEFTTSNPEAVARSFEIIDEDAPISTLLEDERESGYVDVEARMIQTVFSTNAALGYVVVILGFIPYCLVQLMEPRVSQTYLLAALGGAFLLTYALMLLFKRVFFVLLWMFVVLWVAGTAAALTRNIFPLQFGALIFIQSVAVLIYVGIAKRQVSTVKAVALEYVLGIATWLVGIYAFVEQQDWLYGVIALGIVLVSPLYHYFQIEHIGRFSLDTQHLTNAVVHFYGDLLYIFCCKHRH